MKICANCGYLNTKFGPVGPYHCHECKKLLPDGSIGPRGHTFVVPEHNAYNGDGNYILGPVKDEI